MENHKLLSEFKSELFLQDNTVQRYIEAVSLFARFLNLRNKDLQKATAIDYFAYVRHLDSLKISQATKRNRFIPLKLFSKHCFDYNYYSKDFANSVPTPKMSGKFKRKALSDNQICLLLNSIDKTTERGSRDYAIITLLLHNALRRSELLSIDMSDIKLMDGVRIIWIKGKGKQGKEDWVAINNDTWNTITEYLKLKYINPDGSGALFTSLNSVTKGKRLLPNSLSDIVKQRLRAAGINDPQHTCHSLRHTSATMLERQKGITLNDIRVLLRHKSIATTQLYLSMISDEERLKNPVGNTLVNHINSIINKESFPQT